MKISELAARAGVSKDTIRVYEAKGLLDSKEIPSQANGYKIYGEKHLKRLQFVQFLKTLGLTLKECADVIKRMEESTLTADYQTTFIEHRLAQIDKQIEELTRIRSDLNRFLEGGCDLQETIERIIG